MKNGFSSWCRECQLAATQDWRARNRVEINRARREAYGAAKPYKSGEPSLAAAGGLNEIDRLGSYKLDRDAGTISAGVGALLFLSLGRGAHPHCPFRVCVTLRPEQPIHAPG